MLIYVLTNTKKSRIRTERSGFESNEKDSIMYEDIYGADGKTGRWLTLSNDLMFILNGGKAVPVRTTKARKHKLKTAIRKISPYSATTKEFLPGPGPGEHYFSVQSPNAKKAKAGAAYSLLIYSKVGGVNGHSKKIAEKNRCGEKQES